MASSPEAADAGPLSACETMIRPDEFRPASRDHLDRLDPCVYCFPEGEIDQPLSSLLVADITGAYQRSVHRHRDTGPLDYDQEDHHGDSLAADLADPSVTSVSDLSDDQLGGDA